MTKVSIGADHRGAEVRTHLIETLKHQGYEVLDLPTACHDTKGCDYPDDAYRVAKSVADSRADFGILICGSGIGMSIAANKVRGVRAALVHDEIGADLSRRHNNANVLCLSADMLGVRFIDKIVHTWLKTPFEGGRHARRLAKVTAIEQGGDPSTVGDLAAAVAREAMGQ